MTLAGTIAKTFIQFLLLITITCILWSYYLITKDQSLLFPLTVFGFVGAIAFAIFTVMKKRFSPITSPLYTTFEGIFMGGFITLMQINYPGSVFWGSLVVFCLFPVIFSVYLSGIISDMKRFKSVVAAVTSAVVFVYVLGAVVELIGYNVPIINDMGWKGVIFSLFVVFIASLNLMIDFDLIKRALHEEAPAYVEWYGSFTIMVTMFWQYLETLRLFSKLLE